MLDSNKWGKGIPEYKENDLFGEQELLTFAMNAVIQFELEANDYKIIAATDRLGQIPNFVCEKDGEKIFIIVKGAIAPNTASMSVEEKKLALNHAAKFGVKCFFAPVGIGSTDPDRFEASIALKGDEYYFNYQGLKRVEFKKSIDWIKNALDEIEKLTPDTQVVNHMITSYDYSQESDFNTWKEKVKAETFQEMLLKCIEIKGITNQEFYETAYIDRKLFSAIKNNPNYQPKKDTAVACCFGLKLCWQDAEKLLELAGYKLSLSIPWDRVVYYCLRKGITDIDVVNEILYEEGEKCIRV